MEYACPSAIAIIAPPFRTGRRQSPTTTTITNPLQSTGEIEIQFIEDAEIYVTSDGMWVSPDPLILAPIDAAILQYLIIGILPMQGLRSAFQVRGRSSSCLVIASSLSVHFRLTSSRCHFRTVSALKISRLSLSRERLSVADHSILVVGTSRISFSERAVCGFR